MELDPRPIVARGSHASFAINVYFVDHASVPVREFFASLALDSAYAFAAPAVDAVDHVRVAAFRYESVVHDEAMWHDASNTFLLRRGAPDSHICT